MLKKIPQSVFVAPNATVLGDVTVGEDSSVFFGAVIRGDRAPITIGSGTNVQDNCVLHVDEGFPISLGRGVTVGHGAILHGCTVGDNSLIGMGAIVLNGAVIGRDCIVGAGALVPQNAVIPDSSLVLGCPAKVRRETTPDDLADNARAAATYVAESREDKEALGL